MHQHRTRRWLATGALLTAVGALAIGCSSSSGNAKPTDTKATTSSSSGVATGDGNGTVKLAIGDKVIATVDPRYQSYNIEMVEVTGGEFWKPYDAGPGKVVRPPIDLASPRLRNLAKGLGPVYIRVSGTWANSTYFDADGTAHGTAPTGFNGVLTQDEWKGVGAFAKAVDGKIVTSFASNTGTRDANGVWTDTQAKALLEFSKANDIPIYAAEFYNEPSLNIGVPAGYTVDDFGRDLKTFEKMARSVDPSMKLTGPGSAGDKLLLVVEPALKAPDLLKASGDDAFSIFSYHYYPKVSARCGSKEGPEVALTQDYLSRVDATAEYYEKLRDQYMPGAPMWVGETAQAACGGDKWASTYRDVMRYVDTLGRLARGDGDVVFHNTLASSDYGLLDEDGLVPRPDYWAAVLWARLMGPKVVALTPAPSTPDLSIYAHCTAGAQGSVTYAVVNTSTKDSRKVETKTGSATVYQLSAPSLDSGTVALNGKELQANSDGTLPKLDGHAAKGAVDVPPASVAYIVEKVSDGPCA